MIMSKQIENKPRLFHMALAGEEIGVSPRLRAGVSDFVQQMVEERLREGSK
jgi:hypothetical protein